MKWNKTKVNFKVKYLFIMLVAIISLFIFASCSDNSNNSMDIPAPESSSSSDVSSGEESPSEESTPVEQEGASELEQDIKVKMTVDNNEVIITMFDNPTSRDLISRLPLELSFEDYHGIEKVSYLEGQDPLITDGSESGFDPSVGDVTLYAPWGNIAIFYNDFGYSNGLIPLGHIDSGIETLSEISGEFTAIIELMD